jgi:hypothetical protein
MFPGAHPQTPLVQGKMAPFAARQTLPHAPQFVESVFVSAQSLDPSGAVHSVLPVTSQAAHWPSVQEAPGLQRIPQPPQLAVFVTMFVHVRPPQSGSGQRASLTLHLHTP